MGTHYLLSFSFSHFANELDGRMLESGICTSRYGCGDCVQDAKKFQSNWNGGQGGSGGAPRRNNSSWGCLVRPEWEVFNEE